MVNIILLTMALILLLKIKRKTKNNKDDLRKKQISTLKQNKKKMYVEDEIEYLIMDANVILNNFLMFRIMSRRVETFVILKKQIRECIIWLNWFCEINEKELDSEKISNLKNNLSLLYTDIGNQILHLEKLANN